MNEPESEPPAESLPTLDDPIVETEETEENGPGQMSFLDHLEELRWTLFKSFGAFLVACIIIGIFLSRFSDLLRWPYDFAMAGRDMEMTGLINTSILGVFSVIFYLLMGGGLALSLPFILYFVGRFIAPGLNQAELRILRPACFGVFILFMMGSVFSFFILVPAAMKASIIFNDVLGFTPLWTASSYYGTLTWMVLGVGVAFEFPLALLILVYIGILSHEQLAGFRKYSIVIFLCVAAIVTPTTDPVTFLLLAGPLSLLYEVSIFLAKRVEASRKFKEEEEAEVE